MARFTRAYSEFASSLVEVNILRQQAAIWERKDPIRYRDQTNAHCRGAIVLLCSHLESFVKSLGEIGLDSLTTKAVDRTRMGNRIFYHISKDLIDDIKETADQDKIVTQVFGFLGRDSGYWEKSGPFPIQINAERFNKGFSNPAFGKIKTYFNRFGYGRYEGDLASRLKASFHPTTNLVDHLVDTRNLIAHGDLSTTKTPGEVADMINTIRVFCSETDRVFATWWKSSFCSIR